MRLLFAGLLSLTLICSFGQPRQPNAAAIQLKLKKLNVLASALYVAAHPDDENTRAITWLGNDRLAATAYLSMTRGDGGQNLIGPELRDQLGLIRTQELLAARRIDGGQQFFTRANDFGFSKNVREAFTIWGKDEILSDVVRVMRQFQPDIILTRFPPDERAGHGHHTGSAVLAIEAFDLVGKADYQPDQVKQFGTWQPKRVYMNTGRFFDNTINETTPGVVVVNMGTYNTLLGKSYSEIAAESRSQHKSQGFGSSGRRGDSPEYFLYLKGEKADKDLFDGVNTTWTRLPGGDKVQPLVEQALKEFNAEKPYTVVPQLLRIRKQIETLAPSMWRERKLAEVNQLIQDCLGLFAEVTVNQPWMSPGELATNSFELVNRSPVAVQLLSIKSQKLAMDSSMNLDLPDNKLVLFRSKKPIDPQSSYSDPYWLREDHLQGIFLVPGPEYIGKPENGPAATVTCTFDVAGDRLVVEVPLVYKWTDPVKGELSRPFEIVPPVFVNLSQPVFVFPNTQPKLVTLLVKSSSGSPVNGTAKLILPPGWKSDPVSAAVTLPKRGEEVKLDFWLFPAAKGQGSFKLFAQVEINGKAYDRAVQTISYDHIPFQTLLPKAEASLVRVDINTQGHVIGYIAGAGDETPAALRNLGYEVWEMKNDEVTPDNLKKVDAVVLGVRALNTNERIRFFMPDLLKYVEAGGTLIAQYNTSNDFEIDKDKFAPYPLNISRERVTEENSEVRVLLPDHPALNYPNKITPEDFNHWVQERGLYFPDKWDPKYDALLSMNDAGEPERKGSLLVAKYGNGYYVYTGLSFFRELPEGVAGAYKLFANLASLGKQPKPKNDKVKNTK
ncbi:MAG: PIG-L family deacetylase [Cyclobacteriaceae bacterium]|nr:PIG-L family deacetylase [Cyclobacteriaceae bacterium]